MQSPPSGKEWYGIIAQREINRKHSLIHLMIRGGCVCPCVCVCRYTARCLGGRVFIWSLWNEGRFSSDENMKHDKIPNKKRLSAALQRTADFKVIFSLFQMHWKVPCSALPFEEELRVRNGFVISSALMHHSEWNRPTKKVEHGFI